MLEANIFQPLTDLEQSILDGLHSLGLGWGLAIAGLTVLVRSCTLPLTFKQLHSQKEMRAHMPELRRIQKEHKHDKERLSAETMAYYQEHGINPLATFLPFLIQIPVFISLYLLMRHDVKGHMFGDAGFLFIPHITQKPHGAVLAALMITYLVSQLCSSAVATRTLEGKQRGLMMALPVLFVSVVARFPAGLAIYWITTSLWTLGQQLAFWRITSRMPEPAPATATATPAPPPEPTPAAHPVSKKRKRKRRR